MNTVKAFSYNGGTLIACGSIGGNNIQYHVTPTSAVQLQSSVNTSTLTEVAFDMEVLTMVDNALTSTRQNRALSENEIIQLMILVNEKGEDLDAPETP